MPCFALRHFARRPTVPLLTDMRRGALAIDRGVPQPLRAGCTNAKVFRDSFYERARNFNLVLNVLCCRVLTGVLPKPLRLR